MYYKDRERLLFSFLLAVGLYGLLFLILKDLSWSTEPLPPERHGPVLVTLEPLPDRRPVEPPQRVEPEPVPAAPTPRPAPVTPSRGTASSVPSSRPAVTTPAAPPPRTVLPGQGGAPDASVPLQSEGAGTAPPEDLAETGVIEEEAPVDIRGETRIIYAEDALQPQETTPGPVQPRSDEPETDAFTFDDSNLSRAFEASPSSSGSAGQPGSSARAGEPGAGPEHIRIEFEDPGSERRLLSWEDPQLTPEQISRIPAQTKVEVSFVITPDGYIKDPSVIRSTAPTDVNKAVITAMRKWRFEKAENSHIDIEASVLYVIQTK